jgi:hypothetical protein
MIFADSLETNSSMKNLRVVKSRNQVSRPVAYAGSLGGGPAFIPTPEVVENFNDEDDWDIEADEPETDDEMEYTCDCFVCQKRRLQNDFVNEIENDGW